MRSEVLERFCRRDHLSPAPDLAPYIAVAWTMVWNLPEGESFTMQVLPNPSVHIAIDDRQAAVVGVATGAFSATFTGETFVFGLRFRPCGFHTFARQPVSVFTDRTVPLAEVLPNVQQELLGQFAAEGSSRALLSLLEGELRRALPVTDDPARQELEAFIAEVEQNSSLMTVDDGARTFGVSARTLQRLFRNYVGVSPKWMIRRYRLKEAAARIDAGEQHDWADLAQGLGYYDQSHLIKDFREMLGRTPASYSGRRSA